MKNLLFDDFRQWRICLWSGVCKAAWGLLRIVTCILFGIASVFVYIFRQIGAFCKREFVASLIIGVLFILLVVGWLTTFMSERAHRVNAEMQRDSIAVQYQNFKEKHGYE
jgi:hypothetical protein